MSDQYHHGNLKQSLIDAGIKIINEQGEAALSLRKVAAACGVSHAAPYAHFQDKDALMEAIKESVTMQFTNKLEEAIRDVDSTDAYKVIESMGKRYVLFFLENPDYFYFMFDKQKVQVHLAMEEENEQDYMPYLLFRKYFRLWLEQNQIDMPLKTQETELLRTWAFVQGLSSIVCMDEVSCSRPWKEIVDDMFDPQAIKK